MWAGQVGCAQDPSQSIQQQNPAKHQNMWVIFPITHKILLVSWFYSFEKPIPALLEGHQDSIISEVFSDLNNSMKP